MNDTYAACNQIFSHLTCTQTIFLIWAIHLTCCNRNSKSTGVYNTMNKGWIPLICFSFTSWCSTRCATVELSRFIGKHEQNKDVIDCFSHTCSFCYDKTVSAVKTLWLVTAGNDTTQANVAETELNTSVLMMLCWLDPFFPAMTPLRSDAKNINIHFPSGKIFYSCGNVPNPYLYLLGLRMLCCFLNYRSLTVEGCFNNFTQKWNYFINYFKSLPTLAWDQHCFHAFFFFFF